MAKQTKTTKRRTQVKEIPKGLKKLTKGEAKKVKGGTTYDLKAAKKFQGG